MADSDRNAVDGVIVEQEVVFKLADLGRACGAEPPLLLALVREGVLQPARGTREDEWVFNGATLSTARTALRLARELELGVAAVALVLDLLNQNAALRAHLRRIGAG